MIIVSRPIALAALAPPVDRSVCRMWIRALVNDGFSRHRNK